MKGMLDGVRILDLSAVISGPMATGMLADQGAEVIKVEPPETGDMTRGLGTRRAGVTAMFATVNRNKRSIALDLKQPEGIATLLRLAAHCDVFVQNFRPGTAERMGLGYETLRSVRPDVIYLSISGFGEDGPYAGRRVYDPVVQAVTGMTDAQGRHDHEPRMVRTLVCDKVTALTAAQGLAAALFARERTGEGRHLRLSMLDASLYFHWPDLFWNHTFVGEDVEFHADLADLFGVTRTADGWIAAITDGSQDFSGHSTAEALALLDAHDLPCAPVNRLEDVREDPQVVHAGSLLRTRHPRAGEMVQPRAPLNDPALETIRHAAPALGADGAAVLGEAGFTPAEIDALRAAGVLR
ncbi:MAG: CoA transferase [Pseudomonadales bacterium]|jgi:crotonobetainyl-CoA:carnitine CoA-transferase CaiB-like acyl-CoA transferase|nr:CoA transferase [Pseudomonadales bacterium]